jgi:hypothetical protein
VRLRRQLGAQDLRQETETGGALWGHVDGHSVTIDEVTENAVLREHAHMPLDIYSIDAEIAKPPGAFRGTWHSHPRAGFRTPRLPTFARGRHGVTGSTAVCAPGQRSWVL